METNEQAEKTISIREAKVKGLLELYAEKLQDGQNTIAFGIRMAMKYLDIVTDEQIHETLNPEAAKARRRTERKALKSVLEPEDGEEKPKKQRTTRRK